MKKFIIFLTLISLPSTALSAQNNICRRWYSFDIFQTFLKLNIDPKESLIFIDRHIPYGIRPFGSKISQAICDNATNSLKIYSITDLGENFIFSFHPKESSETQAGTKPGYVTYLDHSGDPTYTQEWECSQEAVKNLCLEL